MGHPTGLRARHRSASTARRAAPGALRALVVVGLLLLGARSAAAQEGLRTAAPRDAAAILGVPVGSPAPRAPSLGPTGVHVIRAGESLARIAARYGMRPADLAHLNGVGTGSVLLPGHRLWVPLSRGVDARAAEPAVSTGAEVVAAASEPADGDRYVVRPGDTLYGLSARLGVAMEDLKRWNGLPADGSLRAGDELLLSPPSSGSMPPPAPATGATRDVYVVAPGDTLTSVASRFGTTAAALQRENGLAGDGIWIGQSLTVPRPGSGAAGAAPGGAKRIEIDVSEQRMYVWQGDALVWNWVTSTGIASHPTRRGTFAVQSKIPNAWSSAWQLWMPNWLGIYWAGGSENGIHALPIINGQRLWAGSLGSPISYGCVVLGIQEAELLYNWAEIGTPVVIRD